MQELRDFRINQKVRDAHAEVKLTPDNFILPYFVVDGSGKKNPIPSLKGVYHFSIDELVKDIGQPLSVGINKFILFGVIDKALKDNLATNAYSKDNLISRAIGAIKNEYPQAIVIADTCMCGYTTHGHCGVVNFSNGFYIDNSKSLEIIAKIAREYAIAGVDFVAPSCMMDGQVARIYNEIKSFGTKIFSYSIKYSSNFYGPFRDAVDSSPQYGDRKTYQMDYRNISQLYLEAENDIREGADWLMVKPAHTYLDVINRIKARFPEKVLAGYQVSGEYAMILASSASKEEEFFKMEEVFYAIKRAGADIIISYYSYDYLKNAHSY